MPEDSHATDLMRDCSIVIVFSPKTPKVTISWFESKIQKFSELNVSNSALDSCFALQITATYNVLLKGLEEMRIPKNVKGELWGGRDAFSFTERYNFDHIEDTEKFLTSTESQSSLQYLLSGLRAEEGDVVGDVKLGEGEVIVNRCLGLGIISQVYPSHHTHMLGQLSKHWARNFFGSQPIGLISEYFGIEIASYFAWLGHSSSALLVHTAVGLTWIFLSGQDQFLQDIGFIFISVFNIFWATLCLKTWTRQSAKIFSEWGDIDSSKEIWAETRTLFQVGKGLNKLTGMVNAEDYYAQRNHHLYRNVGVTLVILISLLPTFLCTLCLQQIQAWTDQVTYHQNYSKLVTFLPNILLAIIISITDGLFNRIAVVGNKKNDVGYKKQLFLNACIFKVFNSLLAPLYAVFYLRSLDKLQELLSVLVIIRAVIGVTKDIFIILNQKRFQLGRQNCHGKQERKKEKEEECMAERKRGTKGEMDDQISETMKISPEVQQLGQLDSERSMPKYEGEIDDILELFVQFGFVTLFSPACPWVGLGALLNTLVKMKTGAFNLCFIHQRPFPNRDGYSTSLKTGLDVLGFVGVGVSSALIGLLDPIYRIFPSSTGAEVIVLVLVLEHMLLFLKLRLSALIPDIPDSVAQNLARVEYKRRQADILRNNLTLEEMKVAMEKIETKEMVDKETQFSGPETDTDSRTTVNTKSKDAVFASLTQKSKDYVSDQSGIRLRRSVSSVLIFSLFFFSRESRTALGDSVSILEKECERRCRLNGRKFSLNLETNNTQKMRNIYEDEQIQGQENKHQMSVMAKKESVEKEDNPKLKSKRSVFARGRSMSLTPFTFANKLKFSKFEKSTKSPKTLFYEEHNLMTKCPRGELDFLQLDQVVNMQDVGLNPKGQSVCE